MAPPQETPKATAQFMTPSVLPVVEKLDNQQGHWYREIQWPISNGSDVTCIESNRRQTEDAVDDGKGCAPGHDVFEITTERSPCHLPLALNGKQRLQRHENEDIRDQKRR